MYEDSWYNFIPDLAAASNSQPTRRRGESLLQQPNGSAKPVDVAEPLANVFEEESVDKGPPEASVVRRAKSSPGLSSLTKVQSARNRPRRKKRREKKPEARAWEALMIPDSVLGRMPGHDAPHARPHLGSALLDSSRQEYLLYQDQLALTDRRLASLVSDTDATLGLLSTLASSFRAVQSQTSSIRARCEDLLSEQKRLELLADAVGTDLHYYAYLDGVTRRLNAPGAGRLVDGDDFADMLRSLDACIAFMADHPAYRDAESFLARYQALLTKALHLLEVGFRAVLEKVSADMSRQIASARSESAQHALAYGRYLESVLASYSLVPNLQQACRRVYDAHGSRAVAPGVVSPEIYANTANSAFRTYLAARDRDLRPVVQREADDFRARVLGKTGVALETAVRGYLRQGFERAFNEGNLFVRIFGLEPLWSQDPESAYASVRTPHLALVHPGSLVPLATNVQSALQNANLRSICGVVGSLAHEYLLPDPEDEDETPFARQCRQFAVRLLAEHLWSFADGAFEGEIARTITRGVVSVDALRIGPVVNSVASSNAYPLVKKALELLAMFDQAMPKERAQKDSAVVFKIVRETIQVLQRAEQKLRSARAAPEADPDLFMVKNLLVLKNELVSLEIGDIRTAQLSPSMQHFGQIWDAVNPGRWIPGLLSIGASGIGSIIGGWSSSRGGGAGGPPAGADVTAKTLTVEDMSEQMDELLRRHIYAFTQRWGLLVSEARERRGSTAAPATQGAAATGVSGPAMSGGRSMAKVERDLDSLLAGAFGGQPEVVARLKEAVDINARAANDAKDEKRGVRRY